MRYLFWIGLIIAVYLLFLPLVKAQNNQELRGEVETRTIMRSLICAKDFNFAHKDLIETYGEHVIWEGMTARNQMLVKLYMNKNTGQWTIFEVYPDGSGCAAFGGDQSMIKETTNGTKQ